MECDSVKKCPWLRLLGFDGGLLGSGQGEVFAMLSRSFRASILIFGKAVRPFESLNAAVEGALS
jgi:hypothetical protein